MYSLANPDIRKRFTIFGLLAGFILSPFLLIPSIIYVVLRKIGIVRHSPSSYHREDPGYQTVVATMYGAPESDDECSDDDNEATSLVPTRDENNFEDDEEEEET